MGRYYYVIMTKMFTQTPTILRSMSIAYLVDIKTQLLKTGLYFHIWLQRTCYVGRTAVIVQSMTLVLTSGSIRNVRGRNTVQLQAVVTEKIRGFLPHVKLNCGIVSKNRRGTRWRSWLRHFATNCKVADSIPDGVIWIFPWHNSSGRAMTPRSTQPLTEMSARNISCGVKIGRCVVLTTLPPSLAGA
jgi:hypothetical protein